MTTMTKTMTMCCLVCSFVRLFLLFRLFVCNGLFDRSTKVTKQCFSNLSSSILSSYFLKEVPSTITMGREFSRVIRPSREEGWYWEAGWGWAWWVDGRWWRWWDNDDDVMGGCYNWYWLCELTMLASEIIIPLS